MQFTNLLKPTILGLLCLTFAFTACNNHKKQQEDLQQSVIAVHDSVMMDMGALMEKKIAANKMLTQLDSLKSKKTSLDTAKVRTDLTQVIKELASADDAMMTWMHNFNPDYTGKSHEEVMDYLNDQKLKINAVDSAIKSIIFKSDSVISKYR
ncbi:hypothetical protein [Pedobacter arcticus]|uniref:hypothetical protein n=1 Tax=Pedobacter arcticus TaxID=752140 RepID=UPI0002F529FE|nr:hypothetical protein [Pedobacter arcticus]